MALEEKIGQYLSFLSNCFTAPAASASYGLDYLGSGYTSYQLLPVDDLSRIGIVLAGLAFVGFLLNVKDRYCILCFTWLLFSFGLLGIYGWGASENGMILYTLYFSWALLSLLYAGFRKVLRKHPIIRLSLAGIAFVAMAAVNIRGLRDLILFGINYYPL